MIDKDNNKVLIGNKKTKDHETIELRKKTLSIKIKA